MSTHIEIFDTTLRDGLQVEGVSATVDDKLRIAEQLDHLGVDFIEGGWPGANPKDIEFFARAATELDLHASTFVAFGSTRRPRGKVDEDQTLQHLLDANTSAVCIVAKSSDYHVTEALKTSLDEGAAMIADSVEFLHGQGRQVLVDMEHFFDGYQENPEFSFRALEAAVLKGATHVVLCDTNGGSLPHEIEEIVGAVHAHVGNDVTIGIHCHDDTGCAVANSMAAVRAGARHVQGTLNGLGERTGNANLTSIIPNLQLKQDYLCLPEGHMERLTVVSHRIAETLNRAVDPQAPYVGSSAFAHKAGLHASAIVKDPTTYEHIDPALVGNTRIVPMSNQAGQSNLIRRLSEMGLPVEKGDPALARILDVVKQRETEGYAYDSAQASFELLARRELDLTPDFFDVERYRVISERRRNARGEIVVESEAVVTISTRDGARTSYFKNEHASDIQDDGPVNALWQALKSDLGPYQSQIEDVHLTDFKVRITQGGTEAVTRVIIDFADDTGRAWATVGVSSNIVDASFQALHDAIVWKLVQESRPAKAAE